MIELKNINKFYDKGKSNQNHIIKNTNLTFPSTGLFCLLGQSGSGKTTLLNVIGGLDKTDSGVINVDNISLNKYRPNKWDMIRNHYFGYIFQNYFLLPDLTVYQNLEFVLKLLNLNKEEIDQRIEYALNAVGMLRFKKRKPTQLSGGQQQRVAIARALVKSPNVVIADEPTGNLDDKNTNQIMSIIKKISKECLVILVTHERRIAEFYGDSIIEVSDGKIISQIKTNNSNQTLEFEDNNIYLQEYTKADLNKEDLYIEYFFENKKRIDLKIIFKNDTFYIKSKQDNVKIKLLNNDNEIKIIDSKKPIFNQETVEAFEYHLPKINGNGPLSKSKLSFLDTLKMGFSYIKNLRRKQKILFLIFILTQIIVLFGFISLASNNHVDDNEFLFDNRNLIAIKGTKSFTTEDFFKLENDLGGRILWPANTLTFSNLDFDIYTQFPGNVVIKKNSLLPIDVLSNPKIVIGQLPTNYGEIVIDKLLVDQMIDGKTITGKGILYYEQFIGAKYYNIYTGYNGKVVGIVDSNNPNLYLYNNEYMLTAINATNIVPDYVNKLFGSETIAGISEYHDINTFQKVPFTELKEGEVLISSRRLHLVENGKINLGGEMDYKVVGVYDVAVEDYHINQIILSEEDLKLVMTEFINNHLVDNSLDFKAAYPVIYSENKAKTMKLIDDLGLNSIDLYKEYRNEAKTNLYNENIVIFSIGILIASLIFLYFFMRSSLISRIYEVGVYRALGVCKNNVYKLFASEILLITLITSFIGITISSFLIVEINKVYSIFYYPWYIGLLSFGFILLCNLLVGILPVRKLLRLTPSQILTKYDI